MGTQALTQHADADAGNPPSDGQLLEQFVNAGDPQAFAQLMQRHGSYILGVCKRVTCHAHDAEDVFQACFLELVRKPASICRHNSVAGWLQTVAVRLSLKARARRTGQQKREAPELMNEATVEPPDISWREVRQVLEEELSELPDQLRSVVIMCLFEGHTQEDAAQFLDLNPRTVKDRLRRGRELLSARLTRRGITLSVMGALLSGSSIRAAVPAALRQLTLQGATAVVNQTALADIVSRSVLELTGSSPAIGVGAYVVAWLVGLFLCGGTAFVAWYFVTPATHTIHRTFRGKQFDHEIFKWADRPPGRYVTHEEDGLRVTLPTKFSRAQPQSSRGEPPRRIALPARIGPVQPQGFSLRYPVHGDFQLDVAFEFLQVPPADAPWGAGVTVSCFMDKHESNGLRFGKLNERGRGPFFFTGQRTQEREELLTRLVSAVGKVSEGGVTRLRIVRRGATFSLFVAEGETREFELLQTLKISDEDLQVIRFAADPNRSDSSEIDVRFLDFSITAEKFIGYQPRKPRAD